MAGVGVWRLWPVGRVRRFYQPARSLCFGLPVRGLEAQRQPTLVDYARLKALYPDHILLYQKGSFYELFGDDAALVSQRLPLRRSDVTGMVGFPVHRAAHWMPVFVKAGFTLTLADQVREPDPRDPTRVQIRAQRQVTQIVTPGTLRGGLHLDNWTPNYLLAIARQPAGHTQKSGTLVALAWTDITTGEVHVTSTSEELLADDLYRITPAEILVAAPATAAARVSRVSLPGSTQGPTLRDLGWNDATWTGDFYTSTVPHHWQDDHTGQVLVKLFYGPEAGIRACKNLDATERSALFMLLGYLKETQRDHLPFLTLPGAEVKRRHLIIDASASKSLELITSNSQTAQKKGSLYGVLDQTVTAFGSRELRRRIGLPLVVKKDIEERLDSVALFYTHWHLGDLVRKQLKLCDDLQRTVQDILAPSATQGKIMAGLGALRATLQTATDLGERLANPDIVGLLTEFEQRQFQLEMTRCALPGSLQQLLGQLTKAVGSESEQLLPGYSLEYDKLQDQLQGMGHRFTVLAEHYVARLGAASPEFEQSSSKRKLVLVDDSKEGHCFETLKAFAPLLGAQPGVVRLKDKSSVVARFLTPEISALQSETIQLLEESAALSQQLLKELCGGVRKHAADIATLASGLANLDVCVALAHVARTQGYTRPELCTTSTFEVQQGRHAVVDAVQPEVQFVTNDCDLSRQQHWIITGPNMGGKSTFLRQNALMVIMAQIGSFVPASRAVIGIADRVFARIGSGDNLAENQSTFMVEMSEMAHILHHATSRSFVILDEVGRGTSPVDGLALAAAITHRLHSVVQCRTLSATHLLQLTDLTAGLKGVAFLHFSVGPSENGRAQIHFSHRLVPGVASDSFGLVIAQLAGVPRQVIEHAAVIKDKLVVQSLASLPSSAPLSRAEQELLALYRQWCLDADVPVDGKDSRERPKDILKNMYHYCLHGS